MNNNLSCQSHLSRGVFLSLAVFIFLVGCSDPKSYEATKLTEDQRKELGQKLTADEGKKLAGWMMRHALGRNEPPVGTTVAQALKEQDEWLAKQKEEAAKADELRKKVEAERKAKQEEFAKLLSAVLITKRNKEGEYSRRFIALEIAYENKSDKDILGVKGILKITDIFGDKILNIRWSYDGGVLAKQTAIEKKAGVDVNQFKDSDMKLWNTEFDKLKSTFEISTIIFKDGTTVSAPE